MAAQHGVVRAAPSVLTQYAYALMLERGDIDRHLRRTRRIYHNRRQSLIEALERRLPDASVGGAAAGLHLIAWLPEESDEAVISDICREPWRGGPYASPFLRGYGTAPTRAASWLRPGHRRVDPAGGPGAGVSGRALEQPTRRYGSRPDPSIGPPSEGAVGRTIVLGSLAFAARTSKPQAAARGAALSSETLR